MTVEIFAIDVPPPEVEVWALDGEPVTGLRDLTGGPPGPRGPRGLPGDGARTTFIASTPLSGHRAVAVVDTDTVGYADADDPDQVGLLVGITTQAAEEGAEVEVATGGLVDEVSWTWTPGVAVWCSPSGVLTQTVPTTTAWAQIVGVAASATQLWVAPEPPVIL